MRPYLEYLYVTMVREERERQAEHQRLVALAYRLRRQHRRTARRSPPGCTTLGTTSEIDIPGSNVGGVMTEFAQVSRWRAAFDRIGQRVPLVLLHGGSARRQWFEPMLKFRRTDYQWWLVDLPGHGESSATGGHYSLADVANNLAEFVREVIQRPSAIFGHSFAGQVALVLTAEYPELVRGLLIGDAPLSVGVQRAHRQANQEMTRYWRVLAASDASIEQFAARLRGLRIRHPATEIGRAHV